MRRRSKKSTAKFIIIFILAFVLALLAVQILPVPGELKLLVFFLLIPAVSAVGVLITCRPKRR